MNRKRIVFIVLSLFLGGAFSFITAFLIYLSIGRIIGEIIPEAVLFFIIFIVLIIKSPVFIYKNFFRSSNKMTPQSYSENLRTKIATLIIALPFSVIFSILIGFNIEHFLNGSKNC